MTRELVMLVDSDTRHLQGILDQLVRLDVDAITAQTGEGAWDLCVRLQPHAVVTEVELPDISGFSLCRRIAADERTASTPILFFTDRDQEIDLVVGFELGAADYVSKKVSYRELALRIRRILSRLREASINGTVNIGELVLDFEQSIVTRRGEVITLSPTEFQVLAALARAKGRVLSRGEIIERAWKGEGRVMRRTVDAHIKSLRAKLHKPGFAIATIRGLGYCLRLDEAFASSRQVALKTAHPDKSRIEERM